MASQRLRFISYLAPSIPNTFYTDLLDYLSKKMNVSTTLESDLPESGPVECDSEDNGRWKSLGVAIKGLPEGYDTEVGERGVTVSGGQKQRLAIARALLIDPRILVLDDATSSVDAETEQLIQTSLQRLMPGRTVFVIAQRLSTFRAADRILVFEDGRVVADGHHDDLVASSPLYRAICDHQAAMASTVEDVS